MPTDVHRYVSYCLSFRIHRPSYKHQQLLNVISPSGLLGTAVRYVACVIPEADSW